MRCGGRIEPVDGGGGAQNVDRTEGGPPAGSPRVDVRLEVVDDRAPIPVEQLGSGPQPFAEAGGGDQKCVPSLATRVDPINARFGSISLPRLPPRPGADVRPGLGPRLALVSA